MSRRTLLALAAALLAAVGITGAAIARSNDSEGGASGPQAKRATTAALRATGGGTANAVERDSEKGGTWEVEVTKTDGTVVDVRLDENFKVLLIERDGETSDSGDGQG